MSSEATDDMNEVIAIFDGWKLVERELPLSEYLSHVTMCFEKNGRRKLHSELKYHESWDAIMPVVKTIKSIRGLHPIAGMKAMSELNHGLLWIDIDRIYKGVYQFITWLNQQTTTNE